MAIPMITAAVKMSTGVLHLLMHSCVGLRDQQGTSTTSDHLQTALCVGQLLLFLRMCSWKLQAKQIFLQKKKQEKATGKK
jgi:hypothetical protein